MLSWISGHVELILNFWLSMSSIVALVDSFQFLVTYVEWVALD